MGTILGSVSTGDLFPSLEEEVLMDEMEFLGSVELFSGLNEQELRKIKRLCRPDDRGPGEVVYKEGDEVEDICLVVEGEVSLRYEMPGRDSAREHTISIIRPANVFGWSALVPPYKITLSSYVGDRRCKFYRISRKDLTTLFAENPRIGYVCMRNLTRVIANRFHRMEDDVARFEGMNLMHNW
jgi:CRP/FNR family transcriptional regulator, cyclic AMP receptor protein